MATTTFHANTTLHPWERQETNNLDPHGMAEIIASLGRINLTRSNRSPPDWSIVDTPQAVSNLVDIICLEVTKNGDPTSKEASTPSLYIDIQLVDNHVTTSNSQAQSRGSISLMQIYLLPQDHNEPGHIYLLDVLTLGKQVAFETPRSVDLDLERLYAGSLSRVPAQVHNKITLRTILESPTIPKVFFDVRADADVLYHQYGISLSGVQDLQLMEFAARSICPLGSGLATSSSSASASSSSAGGRSPIRRSSRSRSGSVTPPLQHQHQQHYPLSPPATPSSHTILDSVESSPSSVCSRESFASEASTATTVSISTTPDARAAKPSSEPATPLPLSRTRRRSLRALNNLPRCITRDLNLPLLEQLSFSKWQSIQRKREQVAIANRELERLNKLMAPSSGRTAQAASVSHSGLPLSKQHRAKRAMKESSERYQLLGLEKEVDICVRPLRKEVEWVRDLIGLVVLNVRYFPALCGEYDRRMRAVSVSTSGEGQVEGSEGQMLRERERVWRRRVEEGVRERLELAKGGERYTSGLVGDSTAGGAVGVKGRGKLVMLPPSGWD